MPDAEAASPGNGPAHGRAAAEAELGLTPAALAQWQFSKRGDRRWRDGAYLAAGLAAALGWGGGTGWTGWATLAGAVVVLVAARPAARASRWAGAGFAAVVLAGGLQSPEAWRTWLGLAAIAGAATLPPAWRKWSAALMLGAAGGGLAVVIAQALAAAPWSRVGPLPPWVPLPTAAAVVLLSLGWLAAEPRRRPASLFREHGSAGWLVRRSIPLLLMFPFLASWIRNGHGIEQVFATWSGALGFVGVTYVLFLTLMAKGARALDDVDVSREKLQAYAHEITDLYDHAPCGYHSLDGEGRLVKINDTELAWLGYQRREVVGRRFAELLRAPSRAMFERYFAELKRSGSVPEMEIELRRKDGSWLPAVVSATAIYDRSGQFLRTRSTVFDATQRKQAEAALRRSEARHRAILASAADAIVTLNGQGAIVEFNPAAEWMFGMRRSVALEMLATDLLAPGSALAEMPLAVLAGEVESFPPNHIEFEARRSDGHQFPAELTLTRVAGQEPQLYTAFIRNLTERKRVERELRRSEEHLRLLLNSTGEGIYALDAEGRCTLCNPAAVRLLGYREADELLGRHLHPLVHHTRADGTPYPGEECKSMLAAREGRGIEVDDEVFWRPDGTQFPVEYRSYPIERDGALVGLVVSFTDITTRRGLESQIRQSQKMEAVGRLAAGVAHDFNNLLTVINGYSDMLLEGEPDPGAREKLASVRAAGERAATLTHQLLAFSRQQVLQPQTLDLNAVVRDLEPLLRRSVGQDVELVCELGEGLRPVKADPSQLDQVLMNLVVNANDATAAGGRITISTANQDLDEAQVQVQPGLAAGPYVRLSVRDTGTGIRPEVQAHIFEPFFTTKPQGKGTGLGLPTVFGIARQSGGTILVDSEWGRGTTMHLYLPEHATGRNERAQAGPERALRGGVSVGARTASRGEVVMVVEDEDDLRAFMAQVLGARGYTVLAANGADQALATARGQGPAPALLITDVVMPGLHGPALAAQLRQRWPRIPVLFVSGYSGMDPAPGPHFLQKPFAPETLAKAVRQLLDQASQEENDRADQSRACVSGR